MNGSTIDDLMAGPPYRGYVYAYPHKTAYRPLDPPVPLADLWRGERRDALFLYAHVPFCTMRCGFCNLFTQPRPKDGLAELYLDAFERQAVRVRGSLGDASFARFAMGGGTPTYLDENQFARVFDLLERHYGLDLGTTPACVEASPDTATPPKMRLLRERGVDRLSMGIQSFVEAETADSGRPQTRSRIDQALEAVRAAGFPTLNLDLIYGLPGQTMESWLYSLREALRWGPEELYLYPLYVRPLTGLGRSRKDWDDERLARYRAARDELLNRGYEQVSMRMFRSRTAPGQAGPVYCCQEDGMVGLGCGARSYTSRAHYCTEYAVGAQGVREIIADFISRDESRYCVADHGFLLDEDERRRRFVIQSLLHRDGLDRVRYRNLFGSESTEDFPLLAGIGDSPLAEATAARIRLTGLGLERSDAIGPALFSSKVCALMREYELR